MTEDQTEIEIRDGQEAARILSSEVFQKCVEDVRAALVRDLVAAEEDRLRSIHAEIKALDRVIRKLTSVNDAGIRADKKLKARNATK